MEIYTIFITDASSFGITSQLIIKCITLIQNCDFEKCTLTDIEQYIHTVGRKLFEHLRKVVSKDSYLKQFYEVNICQVMISWLYAIYNKHEMIKTGSQTREKSQVLSQVLEKFCCRLYAFTQRHFLLFIWISFALRLLTLWEIHGVKKNVPITFFSNRLRFSIEVFTSTT